MKKFSQKLVPERNIYSQLNKGERRLMQHILSPLELAAMRHHYQPFSYKIEGRFVYFSEPVCKSLAEGTKERISLVRNRLNVETKSAGVPRKLREVFEDPREILSLTPSLRNRLCKLDCFSMLKIMLLGRAYFKDKKEFGPKSMKVMDDLFAKYKCQHLFR